MKNPVRWFELYVQDMARAKAFYENVFAIELTKIDSSELEMYGFPTDKDNYGATGALVKMDGYKPAPGTIIYFASEDCAIEEARVTPAGGKIQKPKTSIGPYGFISLFNDTEGNIVGIHSMA